MRRSSEDFGVFLRDRGAFPVAAPLEPVEWPEVCTWPSGCDRTALEGRAVCQEHAVALEKRAARLRKAKGRRDAR